MKKWITGIALMTSLVWVSTLDAKNSFDFTSLKTPDSFNYFLACPKNYCKNAKSDYVMYVLPVSVTKLNSIWQTIIAAEPRMSITSSDPERGIFQYQQNSLVFRLPSEITVQFIPVSETESTLAIYSKSVYGYYDFNANSNRVKSWITAVENAITKETHTTQAQTN